MIYEERRYDVVPAFREDHITYLGERAAPTVVNYGGKFVGMFETAIGERNHVYVLFRWDDMNQRMDSWAKITQDPAFWPDACSMASRMCVK